MTASICKNQWWTNSLVEDWNAVVGVATVFSFSALKRFSFLSAIRSKSPTTTIPSAVTTAKKAAMERSTSFAFSIYSPSLCSCPHIPKSMPTTNALIPTPQHASTHRGESESCPALFSLSSIPKTITRMPPSRRKHPNMSEAAFAFRFLTRNVHSQWSAIYRRCSSIGRSDRTPSEGNDHGIHFAPASAFYGFSNFDATGGMEESTTKIVTVLERCNFYEIRKTPQCNAVCTQMPDTGCLVVDTSRHALSWETKP